MKLGQNTKMQLSKLKIILRKQILTKWIPVTIPCEIKIENAITKHISADVAVVRSPLFINKPDDVKYSCFRLSDIADANWIAEYLNPMDIASFIGFPGKSGLPWYDEFWNLGIARTVNIASYPHVGFSNSKIPTSDVLLVSGLSFSGSSGSAVLSHEKGIKVGEMLSGGNYVPPKLIGIMSGHWWNEEIDSDVFRHSGLSYFTRSSAILDLLN